jgi:hypothetical protein
MTDEDLPGGVLQPPADALAGRARSEAEPSRGRLERALRAHAEATLRAAPMPTQMAYDVPIGRVRIALASPAMRGDRVRKTTVGTSRVSPSVVPRATAQTAPRAPATTMTIHAMTDSSWASCRVPGTAPASGSHSRTDDASLGGFRDGCSRGHRRARHLVVVGRVGAVGQCRVDGASGEAEVRRGAARDPDLVHGVQDGPLEILAERRLPGDAARLLQSGSGTTASP